MDLGRIGVVDRERPTCFTMPAPEREFTMHADDDLKARLTAIEGRAPAFEPPPISVGRRRRLTLSLGSAMLLVFVLAAVAVAGAIVVRTDVRGYPGVENPGQPLAGVHLECMSPPQAAAYLATRGYTHVLWQVDSGTGEPTFSTAAPTHGYVVAGFIDDNGQLNMLVDQRTGSSGSGACAGMTMP
jgi:hypothetical protein